MQKDKSKDMHCDYNNFKRARYFHGMLMTDRDFREEQIYHNEKRKMLNRMLHGWGVVCGLCLSGETESSTITVGPGMAIDCHGNEIVVPETYNLNISKDVCLSKARPKVPTTAEECAELEAAQEQENILYIGIKYKEVPTDPVPVYTPGGGCEEKVCDYSRTREGFCVEIFDSQNLPQQPHIRIPGGKSLIKRLNECEQKDLTDEQKKGCQKEKVREFAMEFCSEIPCPKCCPEEHYIILGAIQLNENNMISSILPNKRRQYVLIPPHLKYLFDSLLRGTEKFFIVKKSDGNTEDVPNVSRLHENPLYALCWAADLFSNDKIIEEINGLQKARSVRNMSEKQAKAEIARKNLVYRRTITMIPGNKLELYSRMMGARSLKKGDKVDLVVNTKGKVKFYVGAVEEPGLEVMKAEIDKLKKTVAELKKSKGQKDK
ncbi:MAG: hypothetical protein LWX55_00805 [Deltaproteobacteria bacterium]|jgi:hypothetical protein|nr:hypothetical protein [Deltaproteobacteria bacterium]